MTENIIDGADDIETATCCEIMSEIEGPFSTSIGSGSPL